MRKEAEASHDKDGGKTRQTASERGRRLAE